MLRTWSARGHGRARSRGERHRLIATSLESSWLFVTACSLITPTPRTCHFSSYCLSIVLYSSVSSVRLKRRYGVLTAPPPPSTWAWSTACPGEYSCRHERSSAPAGTGGHRRRSRVAWKPAV